MRRFVKIAAALLVAIITALVGVHAARAHAVLVASAPEDGAVLASAPAEIVLRFNEEVTAVALRVLDAGGRPLALPPLNTAASNTVRVALPALPAGGYLVSWRVVSADSHPVGGSFTFAVGAAAPANLTDDQSARERSWKLAVIANRFVGDAALLLAAGGALALFLVFRGKGPRGTNALLFAALALATVSAALSIPLARGWIAASPAGALLDPAAWALGADAPHRDRVALIVLGLLIAVQGLARSRTHWGRALAAIGALVACAGVPLSGHVAALEPAWPAQATLFLHAAGAAFWIGALPLLALTLRQAVAAEAYRLLRRFSAFAVPIVALLVLAGVGVALTRLRSFDLLLTEDYGRILLAKVALVVLMLVLAVANRRLTRALPAANGRTAARLKRNVTLEIVCAGAVLALTAWLGHTRPPAEMAHVHAAPAGRAVLAVESDGASALVEVSPARRGTNRLVGQLIQPDGRPLIARELTVEFSLPSAGIEPLTARVTPDQRGGFRIEAVALPAPGRWEMRIDALVSDFEKRVFSLQLEID